MMLAGASFRMILQKMQSVSVVIVVICVVNYILALSFYAKPNIVMLIIEQG